jgi:hypothetical protein
VKRLIAVLSILVVLLFFTLFSVINEREGLIALPVNVEGLFSSADERAKTRELIFPVSADDEQQNERIISLAAEITANLDSEYAKLEAIYDWITTNIDYDLEKAANLSAYGSGAEYVLDKGSGVCHDYAELALALLAASGIEAEYRRGEVMIGEGETELHAWNEATADGVRYALDTTWGAGFMLDDKSAYIRMPRRIYLTTPAELARLHSDPLYKQEQEEAYMRKVNAAEPLSPLPGLEQELLALFNSYRVEKGLNLLNEEKELLELARSHAAEYAGLVCSGEKIDLEKLGKELGEAAPALKARSAGMYVLVKWLYPAQAAEDIYEDVLDELSASLHDSRWQALTTGVVRKGDLLIVVNLFLEYR